MLNVAAVSSTWKSSTMKTLATMNQQKNEAMRVKRQSSNESLNDRKPKKTRSKVGSAEIMGEIDLNKGQKR